MHSKSDLYQQIFGQSNSGASRSSTSPVQYLSERGLIGDRPSGNWISLFCPKHKGGKERHPSLRVNLIDGHYRCMACGVSGGGLISLHRLLSGKSFKEAAIDLGVTGQWKKR